MKRSYQKSISRKGHFWTVDDDAFLKNDANLQKIQPEFKQVAEDVKRAYLSDLSSIIHSCYLAGSIPRGVAVPGIILLQQIILIEVNRK